MNLIERLDEVRSRWNILEHPFYRRWECGDLTRDELGAYASEYRHAVVALAEAAKAAAPLAGPEHAQEEAAHVDLWDDFAAALDAEPEARRTFGGLSYSNRSWHVLQVEGAKTDETRQRRLAKVLDELRVGKR